MKLAITVLVCCASAAAGADRSVAISFDDLPRGGDGGPRTLAEVRAMTEELLRPFREEKIPVAGFFNEGREMDFGAEGRRQILDLWLGRGRPAERMTNPVTLGSTMSQNLLIVVAEMIAQSGKEDELRRTLTGFVAPTRMENGCVQYDLHEAEERPGHFFFFEKWTSTEALEAHLASPHIAGALPGLGSMLVQPARISKFRQIA